jgi:hypothetical protein
MTDALSLRIDPDGTITPQTETALDAARALFKHTTVVTCVAPIFPAGVFVGVIDDFGAQDQPLNMKAWACYGRSPIFGAMFLGLDGGGSEPQSPMDPLVAGVISQPIEVWVPEHVVKLMKKEPNPEANRPEMLSPRPTDD